MHKCRELFSGLCSLKCALPHHRQNNVRYFIFEVLGARCKLPRRGGGGEGGLVGIYGSCVHQ
jgi:hypothetical protein